MELLQSIFLGFVQGLTEFLPVSSSAHLNIFPWLFKWDSISPSFDLALHTGTLLAILIYFYKDWIELISGGVKAVLTKEKSVSGKIFWYIVAATVPAGIIGKLCEDVIDIAIGDNLNVSMIVISAALIVMGVLLYFVDKKAEQKLDYKEIGFKKSFLIGFSQFIAGAIPGVSRSGITMTVARSMKLKRDSAAKYSFLLSAPMVGGAVLLSIKDFTFSPEFFAGIFASFISGLIVIKFFMGFIKKRSYAGFAVYRVVFGLFILITALIRL
ncbi:MAG: undecaprenyl-diphosphate phosphatase [Clostridia bacterium]|nr:undecaprenyl-diphosphate phosphatase [Clostridia bacterium]